VPINPPSIGEAIFYSVAGIMAGGVGFSALFRLWLSGLEKRFRGIETTLADIDKAGEAQRKETEAAIMALRDRVIQQESTSSEGRRSLERVEDSVKALHRRFDEAGAAQASERADLAKTLGQLLATVEQLKRESTPKGR
jgi:hypothetical protein